MSISAEMRRQVRQCANFACEYCGVTEIDSAGELTLDHFLPQSKDGADTLDNLLYCCPRCNQYKSDYQAKLNDPMLWNPRAETIETHFLELANGSLFPLTDIGTFTINRMRLNRVPLIANRLRRRQNIEGQQLLRRYETLLTIVERLSEQHAELLESHRTLLTEQRRLLAILLAE